MAKILLLAKPIIWLILVISFFFLPKIAYATDLRVLKVSKFLKSQDSPLVYFAPDFVSSADKYGLDYRLLVAISGTESTFGKNYLAGTYNAYGWGVGEIGFKSWPDGIDQISKALKENYIKNGADDVYKIGLIYCPPTSDHWSAVTQRFMDKIEAENVSNFNLTGPDSTQKIALTL